MYLENKGSGWVHGSVVEWAGKTGSHLLEQHQINPRKADDNLGIAVWL